MKYTRCVCVVFFFGTQELSEVFTAIIMIIIIIIIIIIIFFSIIIIMSSYSRFVRFCGPEQDDKAIYNLVTLLPKRGIYIRVCISISFFLFLFFQQVTAAAPGIDMIPRHFFSRWLTSQDGHL